MPVLLAQATATGPSLIDAGVKEVLGYGVLGVVALLLGFVVYKFYRRIELLQDRALEREKEVAGEYHALTSSIGGTLEDLLDALERGGRIKARPREEAD